MRVGAMVETLIFMVVVGVLWYILQVKKLFGLGSNVKSGRDALLNTLVFVLIAGAIFHVLGLFLS